MDVLSTDDIKLAKSFSSPPKYVKITFEAVLHLLCNVNPEIACTKKKPNILFNHETRKLFSVCTSIGIHKYADTQRVT